VERIDVDERRARLAVRHALAPGTAAADVVEAADRVVGLHATDPSSVHLSAWARVSGLTVTDVERALYVDRTVVKQLAMRRTLFVLPTDTIPDALAGASARVADRERRRLVAEVERAGISPDGGRWMAAAERAVLRTLVGGRTASSAELRDELPQLAGSITVGGDRSWAATTPIAPRVLTVMSAAGSIVRGPNDGRWIVSRPRWSSMVDWLGHRLSEVDPADGLTALVERWLRAFGPGTEADITWWLGSTLTAVRAALRALDAVEVDLDGGTGHVLPDDLEPTPPVEPWAALLPSLDPTTMGWKEREWYLGPHRGQLFDRAGNAGPTAWWDGRVVGGWRQREDGSVQLQLLEDVGAEAEGRLTDMADALTAWFDGIRALPRFPSPLWKRADPA
jgi:hypothetical protein